jgi:hypothetical protein
VLTEKKMKKMMALLLIGALILAAAVMSASAMPDDGYATEGRARGSGSSIQVIQNEEAVIVCIQNQTGNRLTREELKDLRIEWIFNGNDSPANTAVVACSILNQVSAK